MTISCINTSIKNPCCIIVLGMHRSGTSALTGVLNILGVNPGPSLIQAHETVNPKGFWEHAEIVAIHEQLLDALGFAWHDERTLPEEWWLLPEVKPYQSKLIEVLRRDFSDSPLWVVKDPRICRLLPLWLEIFQQLGSTPHFVINLRHPAEVAASLRVRDNFIEAKSYLLWVQHLLEAEYWSRGYPRTVLCYEELLNDWRVTVERIGRELRLSWPINPNEVSDDIDGFLAPSLKHHDKNTKVVEQASAHRLLQMAEELYSSIRRYSLEEMIDDFSSFSDEASRANFLVAPWAFKANELSDLVKTLEAQVRHLEQINLSAHAEIERIKNTYSWKVTKPLRLFANLPKLLRESLDRK